MSKKNVILYMDHFAAADYYWFQLLSSLLSLLSSSFQISHLSALLTSEPLKWEVAVTLVKKAVFITFLSRGGL